MPQPDSGKEPTPSSVTNNLSPSSGENELSGKNFSYGTTSFEFEENTVKHSPTKSKAIAFNNAQTFAYSFNTEEKKLEFQLAQTWGVLPEAISYDEHIQWAKTQYKSIASDFLELIDEKISKTFSNAPAIAEKITKQIIAKSKALLANQEKLLADYLASKYNAVINFDYELTEAALTLTESFNNNLADASSMFIYDSSDAYIVLNDYNALYPFAIQIDDENYIGIPSFNNPQATKGTVEVLLYPFMGLPIKPENLVSKCVNIFSDEENTIKIIEELFAKESSPTLDATIDAQIGAKKLKANFEISTEDGTSLKLTITALPEYLEDNLELGASFELKYTPLLSATYNLVTE